MKYKVLTGIFAGIVFDGEALNDRILNINYIGQSYPIENCIELIKIDDNVTT